MPDWASDATRVVQVCVCSVLPLVPACCCTPAPVRNLGGGMIALAGQIPGMHFHRRPPANTSLLASSVLQVAASVEVEPFVPKENVKIETGGRSC